MHSLTHSYLLAVRDGHLRSQTPKYESVLHTDRSTALDQEPLRHSTDLLDRVAVVQPLFCFAARPRETIDPSRRRTGRDERRIERNLARVIALDNREMRVEKSRVTTHHVWSCPVRAGDPTGGLDSVRRRRKRTRRGVPQRMLSFRPRNALRAICSTIIASELS